MWATYSLGSSSLSNSYASFFLIVDECQIPITVVGSSRVVVVVAVVVLILANQ